MATEGRGKGALDRALVLLARRPLTRAEVRLKLAAEGYDPSDATAAVDRLAAGGVLDDSRLAAHYLLARA
jgi:SOS response regulatory protein OraA/RecX